MYQAIYNSLKILSKGDSAELKRMNLKSLMNSPAYFRVLAYSKAADNQQTQRILYLLINTKVEAEGGGVSVANALIKAGVKESQIVQITRSGDNGIEYLKRQLIRCKDVDLASIGRLSQYWGDNVRRQLLKEYILKTSEKFDTEPN